MLVAASTVPVFFLTCGLVWANDLPVLVPPYAQRDGSIRSPISFDELHNIVGGGPKGLDLDLLDPAFYGSIYSGPYPFESGESDYDYARYRRVEELQGGTGRIRIDKFVNEDKYNSNDWPKDTMTVGYRVDLYEETSDAQDVEHVGYFDGRVTFGADFGADGKATNFYKKITIVEGPYVGMINSDAPRSATIAWLTDEDCDATLFLAGISGWQHASDFEAVADSAGRRHEVTVKGLRPNRTYKYFVQCEHSGDTITTPVYSFETAPRRGSRRPVRIAFVSDSREGVGSAGQTVVGQNQAVLSWISKDAYRNKADFVIFGGDLVNGYTSEVYDFEFQLKAWKQSLEGFLRSKPVYPAMGNHETLINVFDDGSYYGVSLDKWPYATDSAEAIFAQEFMNPTNGPDPADPRRPTYKENVYSFQYGRVLAIAFNNNYWWTTNSQCETYGGSPEGYMLADQIEWIETLLEQAESDRTISYIVLYAQEPVFPCGGHVNDAMWYYGNNNVKAYEYDGANVVPAGPGIIDARNRFWEAIANSSKVAAVLAGDEHAYHRLRVDDTTPVGMPATDDPDEDGVLDQYSPNPNFTYPTWQLTAGTAGAPYYSRQDTPWEPEVFSSQTGYILLTATKRRISASFITRSGQVLDHIHNLMAIKR